MDKGGRFRVVTSDVSVCNPLDCAGLILNDVLYQLTICSPVYSEYLILVYSFQTCIKCVVPPGCP